MGLLAEAIPVSTYNELDADQRNGIKTTKQLVDKRFVLDNKDIRTKTVAGQAFTKKQKEARDVDERYREPEVNSVYDLPKDLSQKATTKRQLVHQRQKVLMEKNQAVFGKPKYGLHGKPLPNYYQKGSSEANYKSQSLDQGGSGGDYSDRKP